MVNKVEYMISVYLNEEVSIFKTFLWNVNTGVSPYSATIDFFDIGYGKY